ncbi:TPA: hypothetical protein RQK93_001704 [Vibrio vulnificus]|uniref:hypothetical protein n=1 Tax=Vibrio vulnificus TaxID=672 RepID=UPI001DC95DCA|nr:hypothetical protein [Vibrio vulnificus]EHH0746988.1 hypothetical protein [Vibrio vulnificus]HDY8069500.1 hypothetical protein [Vibrio vulnificus]
MKIVEGATQLEHAALEYTFSKECPEFLEHLPCITVKSREYTGIGVYVYFEYFEKPSTKLTDSKRLGHSIYAEIEGLKGGAGFVVYIDDGAITLLECFSHSSETWPSVLANFKFHAL